MEIEQVNKIKFIRDQIKEIIVDMIPLNDDEWQFHDELTGIYKTLRKVDLSKLTQTRMNLDTKPAPQQIPLSEAASVITGEDSLNDKSRIDPNDFTPENLEKTLTGEQPKLCLNCTANGGDCDGNGIHLVDGRQECEFFHPDPEIPCGNCYIYANCDILANLLPDHTCKAYQPKPEAPPAAQEPKKRGRRTKPVIPDSEK